MLGKLARRNARRSMRDYSVYLITVTIAFSLMYAFNMLIFSKEVSSMNELMSGLSIAIGFISVIVIGVIEWLVHYMNRFMLEKRSKELGTYMLLGISSRKISRMVLLENMIMGAAAFLAGLLVGTFIYEILLLIIMNLFEVRFSAKAEISLPAIFLTLLYAVLIYAFSMLRMRKKLKKTKIYDFIYAEKQNETAVISRKKSHWILCMVSVGLLAIGCGMLFLIFRRTEFFSPPLFFGGLALIIAGIYGTYFTMASFLVKLFLEKEERKYSKDNLFLYRNLSAKLKTMSFTLGTLAMLLTLTLTCIQSAMLFNRFFELSALNRCSFDAQITAGNPTVFPEVKAYFEKNRGIKESRQVPIYDCGQNTLYTLLDGKSYAEKDYAISYSDYAALRQMLGYEPAELSDGSYLFHANAQIKGAAEAKKELPYTINGVTLSLQEVYGEPLSQSGAIGIGCIIILPDELTEGLQTAYSALLINTSKETTTEDYDYLFALYGEDEEHHQWDIFDMDTKYNSISNSRASIIIFGFSLYYTGLIFICTAATILTIQQLSEASKYRFRYDILSKMGVSERKTGKLIFRQLLIFFGIPLVLPVPVSIFISFCVRSLLLEMITPAVFWTSVTAGLLVFFLIYALYFAATYVGYKKSIL